MFEIFVFLAVLAIIRLIRRLEQNTQHSVRIDIYHHWPDGGPGEQQPEDQLIGTNVVQLRRR